MLKRVLRHRCIACEEQACASHDVQSMIQCTPSGLSRIIRTDKTSLCGNHILEPGLAKITGKKDRKGGSGDIVNDRPATTVRSDLQANSRGEKGRSNRDHRNSPITR
jgi:hypothetical protein